ncbi:MAG: PAS domain S-box protein [Thermoanaerobaculales bacterium]
MSRIRILQLEDDAIDAELITSTLERSGLNFEVVLVDTREAFVAAFESGGFDLVLADYSLPAFDGITALGIVRERHSQVPFILVSGTLGEEVAIEALKAGATDYVLKNNLSRLAPAARRALDEAAAAIDRSKTEEALRESEEKLRNIVENSTNLFFAHTPDHVLTYLSPQCRDYLDCEPEEAMILWTDTCTENPVNERGMEITQRAIDTGERQDPYELELRTKSGRTIWVEVREAPVVRDGKTVAVVGALADITGRKKNEQALRESEEKYRDLVEKAGVAIVVDDEVGHLRYFNQPFMELFGFSDEELNERTIWDLIHPDDLEMVRDHHTRRFSHDPEAVASYSFRGVRKDRETLHLEINTTAQVKDGRMIRSRSFIRDVTDHKRLEAQLAQMQKLEALGQLAGGIAHDFNNLLMSISGSAELLGFRFSDGDSETQELDTIRDTVARGAELTQRLLAIARQQVLEMEVTDLRPVIEEELKILRRVIPENIQIDYQPATDLPAVMADHGQLGQVLMNLVVNARDAMPEGGTITIETESSRVGGREALRRPGVATGSYVHLSVKDTGEGMDAPTLVRIFDPFFTTKEEGAGSGMGLATVYGIVQQHGGFIEVESAPGEGSKFDVFLPVTTKTTRDEDDSGGRAVVGGSEAILVVEDEPSVRSAIVGMLEALGYTAAEAADGSEALELLRAGVAADLVLSDVVMPTMGGHELLEKARKLNPGLPFLFSSGYTDQPLRDQLDAASGTSLIAKPFNMKNLSRAVRLALSQEEPE